MSTTLAFKAHWSPLLLEITGVIGGSGVIVLWQGVSVTWVLVTLLLAYLGYKLFVTGAAVKTVNLRMDGIDVIPLLPWFKPRRWRMEELATYKAVAFAGRLKGRPFMGILAPKDGKHEMIWASGTTQFSVLNELLSRLLPPPQEHPNQSASVGRE